MILDTASIHANLMLCVRDKFDQVHIIIDYSRTDSPPTCFYIHGAISTSYLQKIIAGVGGTDNLRNKASCHALLA